MGAGRGRHWELLVQRFRVSACAGVDKSRIQDTAGGRPEEEEDSSVDQKKLWVEHILIKEEGEGSEPGGSDFLLEEAVKVSMHSRLCFLFNKMLIKPYGASYQLLIAIYMIFVLIRAFSCGVHSRFLRCYVNPCRWTWTDQLRRKNWEGPLGHSCTL
jgi:hypothetical protein